MIALAKVFEPSIAAAARDGPKTGNPDRPEHVGEPRHERHLRPDDDELDVERAHETEHGLGVVRPHGVALPESGDAGVARERRGAR